ncbi:hypothetical protein CsatB_004432 [Cannabis sativa]
MTHYTTKKKKKGQEWQIGAFLRSSPPRENRVSNRVFSLVSFLKRDFFSCFVFSGENREASSMVLPVRHLFLHLGKLGPLSAAAGTGRLHKRRFFQSLHIYHIFVKYVYNRKFQHSANFQNLCLCSIPKLYDQTNRKFVRWL